MDAAEDLAARFNAVPDDPAVTMRANRRQRVDRALEAVEGVVLSANDYFKRLVVFIFTNFACSHTQIFSRLSSFAAVFTWSSSEEIRLALSPGAEARKRRKARHVYRIWANKLIQAS